jgi:broad specificity phosphatase PhoE
LRQWEDSRSTKSPPEYPDEWAARSLDPFITGRRGQNLPDMLLQSRPCGAITRSTTRKLAIVSHGISGRVLLTHFLGLKPSKPIGSGNRTIWCRLSFSDGEVSCDHFRNGEGPHPGSSARRIRSASCHLGAQAPYNPHSHFCVQVRR